eukprot:UN33375
MICDFIYEGGNYFGAVGGAFLACRQGYVNCSKEFRMVGCQCEWQSGMGSTSLKVTDDAKKLLSLTLRNKVNEDYMLNAEWNNGCCFGTSSKTKNTYKEIDLPSCVVLARFNKINFRTGEKDLDFNDYTDFNLPYKGAIVYGEFGKGKVIVSGPHIEFHTNNHVTKNST